MGDVHIYILALPFSEFADKYFESVLSDRLAELPPHLATVRKISAWYKVPKIKDLYPVPGKHYTADCQSADTPITELPVQLLRRQL